VGDCEVTTVGFKMKSIATISLFNREISPSQLYCCAVKPPGVAV
jgi:hypothetical protein